MKEHKKIFIDERRKRHHKPIRTATREREIEAQRIRFMNYQELKREELGLQRSITRLTNKLNTIKK